MGKALSKSSEASTSSRKRGSFDGVSIHRKLKASLAKCIEKASMQATVLPSVCSVEEKVNWVPPKPHPWPKTKAWSNDEIVKATVAFDNAVRELKCAKMPAFSAVDVIRDERSKND